MNIQSVFIASVFTLATTLSAWAGSIEGKWSFQDDSNEYHVQIGPCLSKLCGDLIALIPPNGPDGRPKVDHNNHDNRNPSLRTRPLLGLQIVTNVVPQGDRWVGDFYNPDDGDSYTVTFTVTVPDQELNAKVCCKLFIWKNLKLTRLTTP
jgi:uncharacterized protein (DUF2147 family)